MRTKKQVSKPLWICPAHNAMQSKAASNGKDDIHRAKIVIGNVYYTYYTLVILLSVGELEAKFSFTTLIVPWNENQMNMKIRRRRRKIVHIGVDENILCSCCVFFFDSFSVRSTIWHTNTFTSLQRSSHIKLHNFNALMNIKIFMQRV